MPSSGRPPDISQRQVGNGVDANLSSVVVASEIQPGTGTSTSTVQSAAATEPKKKKFPFFKFPPEIRHIIYRHAWTVDPKRYTMSKTYQLRYGYMYAQMRILTKMGSVSRQMRDEAYSEFFHRAQAYLRWNTQMQGYSHHNLEVMRKMQVSFLMRNYLQHVAFHWPENHEHRMSTFRWLENLSQLRTLKVVLSGGPNVGLNEQYSPGNYSPKLFRRLTMSLATRNANFPGRRPWVMFDVDKEELMVLWNQLDWFSELLREIPRGTVSFE